MKALKNFDFPAGVKAQYDWDKILDGGTYEVVKGEDYECEDQTFRMMAYKQGRTRGKTVQVAQNENKTGLVIKATQASDTQIAQWASDDAERKAKKLAAKQSGDETSSESEEVVEETVETPKKSGKKSKSR